MTGSVENVSSHSNQQKRKPNTLKNSRKKYLSLKSRRPSKRHHVTLRRMSRGSLPKSAPIEVPHRPIMKWTLDGWCEEEEERPSCSSFIRNAWERKPFKSKLRLPSPQNDPSIVARVEHHSLQSLSPSSPQLTEVGEEKNISFHTRIHLAGQGGLSDERRVRSVLGVNGYPSTLVLGDSTPGHSQSMTKDPSSTVDDPVRERGLSPSINEDPSSALQTKHLVLDLCSFSHSHSKDLSSDSSPSVSKETPVGDTTETCARHVHHLSSTVESVLGHPHCLHSILKDSVPSNIPQDCIVNQTHSNIEQEEEQSNEAFGTNDLSVGVVEDQDSVSLSDIDVDVESLADTLRSLNCHCDTLPAPFNRVMVDPPLDYSRGSISTSSSATITSTSISTTTEDTADSCSSVYGQTRFSRFSRHRRRCRNRRVQMRIARRPRKILVLGDMMSGKTNLISSYCSDRYHDQYVPTFFRCTDTDATVQGENIKLVVLDISGRDDFAPLRKYAYYKVDAVVFCYPVNSIESLERIRSFWVPELKEHAPKAPFVVVGTKRDVRDTARDKAEECKLLVQGNEDELQERIRIEAEFAKTFVSYDRGKRLSNELGAQGFYECSAMYRDGTRNLFESVTMVALQKSRRKRKTTSKPLDSMCTIL